MWGKACSRDFLEWNSWLRGKVIFRLLLWQITCLYRWLSFIRPELFCTMKKQMLHFKLPGIQNIPVNEVISFSFFSFFLDTMYMSIHLSKLVLLLYVLVGLLIWLIDLVLAWSTFLFRKIPWPSPCQGGSSLCYFQQICHPTPFQEIQQRSGFLSPANWRSCIHWRGKRHQCCCGQFLCLHWQKLCHRQKMYNKRLCLYRGWDYFTPWNCCARL